MSILPKEEPLVYNYTDALDFLQANGRDTGIKFRVIKINSQYFPLAINDIIELKGLTSQNQKIAEFINQNNEVIPINLDFFNKNSEIGISDPDSIIELMKLPELTPAEQAAETTEMLAEQAAERTEMLKKLPEKGGRRIKRRRTKRRRTKRRRTRRHRSYRK